jgi:hypothetical protein
MEEGVKEVQHALAQKSRVKEFVHDDLEGGREGGREGGCDIE